MINQGVLEGFSRLFVQSKMLVWMRPGSFGAVEFHWVPRHYCAHAISGSFEPCLLISVPVFVLVYHGQRDRQR